MADPGTAAKFVAALKASGVRVAEHDGWRTHNRAGHGGWGPLHGVMVHHTAGTGPSMAEYVYQGDSALPGPLCHCYIDKAGTVHLIGWGRANHAGGGDPDVLKAVIAEAAVLPDTGEHQGSKGAVDGNAHFIGFECENAGDGADPWPDAQLDAMVRAAAAVCGLYGWSARSVVRHMDWSDWKRDPRGVDWPQFLAAVQKRLGGPVAAPEQVHGGITPPEPSGRPVVSLAHVINAARRDPGQPQGRTTHREEVLLVERALENLGYLGGGWADGSYGTRTLSAYARLQRHLGYTGGGADGIPGAHSLTWLGLRSGLFRAGE